MFEKYRDPKLCNELLATLKDMACDFRFMEVCGTHTVAIFQSGLASLLPKELVHVSGPGCPVCVTHDAEVAAFQAAARKDGVIVATFGDLMRVPGPDRTTLKQVQAEGGRVEVVYAAPDALALAKKNPDATVVFVGVGFETTAPTIAATVKLARSEGVENFKVLCLHKTVPPALKALLADPECKVDGFLLPGHVSAIIGVEPYRFLADDFGLPAVVTGFEPADILAALITMLKAKREGRPQVVNAYPRVVRDQGNPVARAVLEEVFTPTDALWRGIGSIPGSGLAFAPAYRDFDAATALDLRFDAPERARGCQCGDVLKGKIAPPKCALFAKACTPASPVGPCMVSTEGSCAAYYKYRLDQG